MNCATDPPTNRAVSLLVNFDLTLDGAFELHRIGDIPDRGGGATGTVNQNRSIIEHPSKYPLANAYRLNF